MRSRSRIRIQGQTKADPDHGQTSTSQNVEFLHEKYPYSRYPGNELKNIPNKQCCGSIFTGSTCFGSISQRFVVSGSKGSNATE